MSKDKAAGGNGADKDDDQVEEFTVIEVDDKGDPINQQDADDGKDEDADDDLDADADDDGEEHDEDERLGHEENEDEGTRAGETAEEKRERRRQENRTKRIRNRVAAEAKDRLLENQGRLLLNLQEQVAQLQGRSVQYDVNLLSNQLEAVQAQQTDAKAVLAKLTKAQDAEGIAEVIELQMNLRDQHRQITEQLKRAKTQAGKGGRPNGQGNGQDAGDAGDDTGGGKPPARRPPQQDPDVVARAETWMSKHKFADPRKGADPEEVAIVSALDKVLAREGFNPKTDEYWKELTKRVQRRLPHRFKKAAPNGAGNNGRERVSDDTGGKRPAQGGPRMAQASQSGGGNRPLGKNEVRVTPARKAAMQAAGKWDDPVLRNKQLAAYAKYDREQADQG